MQVIILCSVREMKQKAAQVRLKWNGWTTLVIRPFGTFAAKQRRSFLTFYAKK